MATIVRDYRPGDEEPAYFVCLKTGNNGDDGEPFYQEDPDALGRIFVGPYLRFEPELALMLEDEEGVCGYALGALDSRTFYERYEREWRPELLCAVSQPRPATRRVGLGSRQSIICITIQITSAPSRTRIYPAHLHIDLMSRAHRQGHGTADDERVDGPAAGQRRARRTPWNGCQQ